MAYVESFTCPRCGITSWNPNDVREGFCGRCHDWTGEAGAWRTPRCPLCGQPPVMTLTGGTQAFCGTDDCPWFTWNPSMTLAELNADANVIDLREGGNGTPVES